MEDKKKWMLYGLLALLTIPTLISLLTDEPNGSPRNSAGPLSNTEQKYISEDKAQSEKNTDPRSLKHLIPRKEYNGTNHTSQGQIRQNRKEQVVDSQTSSRAMDQILANDLSLTTSLFIAQLEEQLERWSQTDFDQREARKKFAAEVKKHKHFKSFGLLQDGILKVEKGNINQDRLEGLKDHKDPTYYSDPYVSDEKQVMMIGKKVKDNWLVGEIDLSFLKGYVSQLASVTDANGNFFISSDEKKDVEWSSRGALEEDKEGGAVIQKVPELDWQIVIHSKGEEENERTHYPEHEVVIQFEAESQAREWLAGHPDFTVKKEFGSFLVVHHPQWSTEELMQRLSGAPGVVRVEPNYIFTKQDHKTNKQDSQTNKSDRKANKQESKTNKQEKSKKPKQEEKNSFKTRSNKEQSPSVGKVPNDEFFKAYQWNLAQIRAPQGWEVSEGSEEIIIAYLDTGVDRNHEDLRQKIKPGYNTFDKSNDITDYHGHGTHVAGIIGAVTNNLTGIAGLSWKNPIMPVKVLDENGEGSIFEIASGIIWATDHGAKVINMSLGDSEHSEMLYEAIRYAYERDVVLIAAAGNDNVETPMYPSAYEEVIAVAAVNEQEQKAEFSNYGQHIDVAAPGENIPSTFLDSQYVFMSGTSMAAPHVTGFAGLLRALKPNLTNDEIMEVIKITTKDLGEEGHDPYYGYGLINIQAAMEYLQNNQESLQNNQEKSNNKGFPDLEKWLRKLFNRAS